MDFPTIAAAIAPAGLILRGGFRPNRDDDVPLPGAAVVLVGNAGPAMWRAFTSQVLADERRNTADPLDAWIRRILRETSSQLGAQVLFPFDGPPFLPFLRWARRAESVYPSPIGPLIHPEYGLHHAYRGALVFADRIELPANRADEAVNPCAACPSKPCLSACPVGAIRRGAYDVEACLDHLGREVGDCMTAGCRARRACPVGRSYHYSPAQAAFHMDKFRAAQTRGRR